MSLVQVEKTSLHSKTWGHEEWFIITELYTGKRLVVTKGTYCSVHGHRLKDETFVVEEGHVKFEFWPSRWNDAVGNFERTGPSTIHFCVPGDTIRVKPGLLHRFTGLGEYNSILEFSTTHFESDSYRVEPAYRPPQE